MIPGNAHDTGTYMFTHQDYNPGGDMETRYGMDEERPVEDAFLQAKEAEADAAERAKYSEASSEDASDDDPEGGFGQMHESAPKFDVVISVDRSNDVYVLHWPADHGAFQDNIENMGKEADDLGLQDTPTDPGVYVCTIVGWTYNEDDSEWPVVHSYRIVDFEALPPDPQPEEMSLELPS